MFQFWLGFPGFHVIGDTYNSIALAKNDAHPVFIAYVVEFLYKCFGKHLYYLYLFNLVPFYVGLGFLVCGLYIHFRSKFALLALFPLFIGNIYFQNFIIHESFSLPMLLLCLYSLLLFLILVPLNGNSGELIFKWILCIFLSVLIFFALLWRHNAIFSVYPAFFIICYLLLRGLEGKKFVLWYIVSLFISALLCVGIVIGVPKALVVNKAYPANHMMLHKIAGACVPADDSSCFRAEWYEKGKTWEDVKEVFYKYPLNADPMSLSWISNDVRPFKPNIKLEGLNKEFFKAVLKYPKNFLKLEGDFIKAMWTQSAGWALDPKRIQVPMWNIASPFPENERNVTFSPLREKIYTFLFKYKMPFNHIINVITSSLVMIFSLLLLCIKREKVGNAMIWLYSKIAKILGCDSKGLVFRESSYLKALLVFSFSVGFAGFFSALFIAMFNPIINSRYMSPVTALGVMAFIGFVVCVCEYVRCVREREV
ncbi:hypothetical protein CQA49_08300 [Helicobacter sp. MIT 00-7814]|nr:hypothetical protein CQA37_08915 [Helicobacter sp. MIT 99-10781]RDU52546.1 hypothetical protein CQA49_08300 [Helicobacter sp. MIT 00-7814]